MTVGLLEIIRVLPVAFCQLLICALLCMYEQGSPRDIKESDV